MECKEIQLKNGINLHIIPTNKFKTNLMVVFLTTELNRENVTKNALISTILRRGSKTMPSQEEISKNLEEMYGATFNCGLDKTGDNQVLKFFMETVNDNFLPKSNINIMENSIQKLIELVFDPYIENEGFKEQYVEQEKNRVREWIEARKDNKASYALEQCIEEMYKNQNFGLYKYGYIEDLDNINAKNLFEYYQTLIKECKIDIYISGMIDEKIVEEKIRQNQIISKLEDRNPKYNNNEIEKGKKAEQENTKEEKLDVAQGKLVLGLDVELEEDAQKYDTLVYNSILGGTANSKLFQNVREKASLAYAASSSYLRTKSNIFINCGIEIENYTKALGIIKVQIKDMKEGKFTDEEVENAKTNILDSIQSIEDEQDSQIIYYFGQEISKTKENLKEYQEKIKKVTKQDVLNIANKVSIEMIYFLRN